MKLSRNHGSRGSTRIWGKGGDCYHGDTEARRGGCGTGKKGAFKPRNTQNTRMKAEGGQPKRMPTRGIFYRRSLRKRRAVKLQISKSREYSSSNIQTAPSQGAAAVPAPPACAGSSVRIGSTIGHLNNIIPRRPVRPPRRRTDARRGANLPDSLQPVRIDIHQFVRFEQGFNLRP